MRSGAGSLRARSLGEIHSSVRTSYASPWRRLLAFAGPAYLVSVGYMDPGNWVTDLEGGAAFGYRLLWVLVMSNAMAILFQTLSARLGVVAGCDLAQACRQSYSRGVNVTLWVLCEIAIAACDLAEVLGAAFGLNLLFHLPLLAGVLVTAGDTLLLLWLQQYRIRTLESVVLRLILIIGFCLGLEVILARPSLGAIAFGAIPQIHRRSLYAVLAILGATVMPHNLYLHSALVQSRRFENQPEAKRRACRYNLLDTLLALNGAMFVNIAILVLAAATFFHRGIAVTDIRQATGLLEPLLGSRAASVAFAVALLCAGQASTITGTMAGQIVVEGFLQIRMRAWLRRLATRLAAIIPAALTVYLAGDHGAYDLLLLTQVILCMQLPFAAIPLIHFTSDRRWMGEFASPRWLQVLAWVSAGMIVVLAIWLSGQRTSELLALEGLSRSPERLLPIAGLAGLIGLLAYLVAAPWLGGKGETVGLDREAQMEAEPEATYVQRVANDEGQEVLERFDHFLAPLRGVVFVKDANGRYLHVNGAAQTFLGVAAEQALNRTDAEIRGESGGAGLPERDERVLQKLQRVEGLEVGGGAGAPRLWLVHRFPIVERETQSVFLGGIGIDVTEQSRAEEELQRVVQRLHILRERDRAEASREVHDVAQTLAAVDLQLHVAAGELSAGAGRGEIQENLRSASGLLSAMVECSARIAGELHPSTLDNLGLTDAIVSQGRAFAARTGIRVTRGEAVRIPLRGEAALLVYRIVEEVLSNVERHAGATEVCWGAAESDTGVTLTIRDNGRGIAAEEAARAESLGLAMCREMARQLGGQFQMEGVEGEGTAATLWVPASLRSRFESRGAGVEQAGERNSWTW